MRTLGLTTLVVALVAGTWYVAPLLVPGDDDGLGTGLTAFMLLGTVAVLIGLWDGLHEHRLVWVFVRSALISVVAGVVLPVLVWTHDGSTLRVLVDDIVWFVPFMAVLMGAPAAFFGWMGWAAQGRTRNPGPRRS